MFGAESQIINGTAEGLSGGFEGFVDEITTTGHEMAVDAGGSTDLSSCWLFRTGRR